MKQRLFANLHSIQSRMVRADGILLFLDFDGTLVPIVSDPAAARLSPETKQILYELAQNRRFRVAVISGRSLDDLMTHVGISEIIYAANHGFEIRAETMHFLEPAADRMKPLMAVQAETLAHNLLHIPGVQVENKGWTLSIHFRRAPAGLQPKVVELVRKLVPTDGGYRLTEGKKVIEVRPSVDWDKGKAVLWIQKRTEGSFLPIYIGDDSTDEDAFSVLPCGITVRVGESSASQAKYSVADSDEVRRFLQWLAAVPSCFESLKK
jgi:trehalose 6-phosphate phosphatase